MVSKNRRSWSNLSGACTIYYDLQNHEEEIICYDKALKINPNLPQALFSKGATLSHIYKKYEDGLSLMLTSIRTEEEMMNGFPIGFFWIAYTYEKLGNITESLYYINKGLSIEPENLFMLDFKTDLLIANCDKDDNLKSASIPFFEYRLELGSHLKSLYHLIRVKEIKDEKLIWELIAKYTSIARFADLNVLEKCELKLPILLSFLLHYDKYLSLRESYPLNRYMNHLISEHFSIPSEFYKVMDLIFAKSFSEAIEEYQTSENINRIGEALLRSLSLLPHAILALIPDNQYNQDEAIAIMSHTYLEYHNVAAREFGIQMGLITGKFGLDTTGLEDMLTDSWQNNFRQETLIYTNRVLKLLKEE